MKSKNLFLILILIMPFTLKAQENQERRLQFVEVYSTGYDGTQIAYHINPQGRYQEIKGSPYLFEEWKEGAIMLKSDTVRVPFRMRFNVYGNEMQFIHGSDTFAISNPHKVGSVWLESRRFQYMPFMLNGNQHYAYFEILVDGKYKLLKLNGIRLDAGTDPVTPYHCQNSTDRFVRTAAFYYQYPEGSEPVLMPSSRSGLSRVELWADRKAGVFMKEARIHPGKESDLIRLFEWLNQSK
jgi:hypothetical protein